MTPIPSQFQYSRGIKHVDHIRYSPSDVRFLNVCLANARVLNNEKDVDLDYLTSCIKENKWSFFDGWIRRLMGETLLNIDDQHMAEAEDWIKEAIKFDKQNGMMFHLGLNYISYAELFKRKGDQSKAKENLNKAIEILKECGADGWVKKYEKELMVLT